MEKTKTINKSYSLFLAVLPILNLYKSVITNISLGEIGLIIFALITIILMLMNNNKIMFEKNRINTMTINFFMALLFFTCLAIIFIGAGRFSAIDVFNRFIRLALWAVSISFVGYYLFNYEHAKKWIVRISVIATIYIIAQYLLWLSFNIYLPSVISNGIITPASEGYADTAKLIGYYNNFYYRPASFFAEPAFYSYYSLVGLVVSLFRSNKPNNKTKNIIPIFLSIGILISTSTAGIYLMLLVWGYYVYKKTKGRNTVMKLFRIGFLILSVLLILTLAFTLFDNVTNMSDYFSKLQIVMRKPFDFYNSSRLGKSYSLFNQLDGIQRFIGVGFGNEDIYLQLDSVYYNSITVLLLSTGYAGLMAFFIFVVKLVRRRKPIAFILAVIYSLLCFTSSMLYSSFSIIYLTIILYAENFVNLNSREEKFSFKPYHSSSFKQ